MADLSARQANLQYFRRAYQTGEHGWEAVQPTPALVDLLKSLKHPAAGGTLLDVGCGEGRHAIAAAKLGFRVTGVDFIPEALERARAYACQADVPIHSRRHQQVKPGRVCFRRGDVFNLPFAADSFDIVLDCGCLHHQRKGDWPAYKANILKILRPRGYYLLSVFSPKFHLFAGAKRRWHLAHGSYRRCFGREDIDEFAGGDFEIITQRHEPRGFWHTLMQRV